MGVAERSQTSGFQRKLGPPRGGGRPHGAKHVRFDRFTMTKQKTITIGPCASAERRVELDLGEEGGRGGETLSFLHEDPPSPPPATTLQDPCRSALTRGPTVSYVVDLPNARWIFQTGRVFVRVYLHIGFTGAY